MSFHTLISVFSKPGLLLLALALLVSCGMTEPPVTPAPPVARIEPTQAATPRPTPNLSDTRTRPTDGMAMIYVPGGTFPMGSSDAQVAEALALCQQYPDPYGKCQLANFEGESPQHTVTLDGFWIDRTEVTNAQYALCVADGACRKSRLADDPAYNGDNYPTAGTPWQDAADYCAWAGGRLPTEAEWEYAARGAKGRAYPWGDKFDCAAGNFWDEVTGCDDGHPKPAPVGSFPAGASWCGVLDLAGNVWEWVADAYAAYPAEAQTNPAGPASGSERILRGGSWGYHPPFVRTAYRYPVPPTADYLAVGFRCAGNSAEIGDADEQGAITVGLFAGEGAHSSCVTAATRMFEWMGHRVVLLDARQVNDESLDGIDLLYFPGGSAGPYQERISNKGKEKIRQLIKAGGCFIGTCAGALFAAEEAVWKGQPDPGENLGLFPGTVDGPLPEIYAEPEFGMCQVNLEPHPITGSGGESAWILYYNGPFFKPNPDAQVDIVGRYNITNEAALIAFEYGDGRVFLTGPHPEWEEDSYRDGVTFFDWFDDQGSDWELMRAAVRWCVSEID